MKAIGIVILAVVAVAALPARATTCRAQLIHTVCGSGIMEITFMEGSDAFELHNGDVRCWMGDARVRGILEKNSPMYPFFLENTYDLYTPGGQSTAPVKYGQLLYDPRINVASLRLNTSSTLTEVYNLTCEEPALAKVDD